MGFLLMLAVVAVAAIVYFACDKVIFEGETVAMVDWGPTLSKTHKVAHIIFGDDVLPGNAILVASVTNEQAGLIKSFKPACFVNVTVRRNSLTRSTRVTRVEVIGKSRKALARTG